MLERDGRPTSTGASGGDDLADRADLADLRDRIAIRELVARYNRAADDGDVETFVGTFTPDGVFDVVGGPTGDGHEGIRAMISSASYGSVHVTTDPIVEVRGDRASHTCTLLLCCRRPDGGDVALVSTGRYDDELVRTPSGWRFSLRRAEADLAFDLVNERFREILL